MNNFGQSICDNVNVCERMENLKNRYIYINQNVTKVNRVLINPNFKPTIHINPNFQKNLVPLTRTIHVNPLILNANRALNQNVNNNLMDCDTHKTADVTHSQYISSNNNKKLIRASLLTSTKTNVNPVSKNCYRSKSLVNNKLTKTNVSKFKVDRRTKPLSTSCCNEKRICNVSTRFVFIKNVKLHKTKYIKLNGKLYKYSRNKLVTTNISNKNAASPNKTVVNQKLYRRPSFSKSKINSNLKYSKLNEIMKRSKYKIVRKSMDKTKNIILEKKLKSRRFSIKKANMDKLKKCNLPCEIYQRYGKCARKEIGKCLKIHNPKQIALCAKFLRGACVDSNCLLAHNLSPEKMPTCNYFLEGRCFKDDCPYLHVKVSAKADICKDFLVGYCTLAKDCLKRHQYLCPDFEKYNICKKVKCPYPHGNIVRDIKLLKKVTKGVKIMNNTREHTEDGTSATDNNDKNARYYVSQTVEGSNSGEALDVKREKIGTLPTYIPLYDNSS